jgi:hypothetical protein
MPRATWDAVAKREVARDWDRCKKEFDAFVKAVMAVQVGALLSLDFSPLFPPTAPLFHLSSCMA